MRIIAHPDNITLLRDRIDQEAVHLTVGTWAATQAVQFVASPYMDRTKKTGRYILPGGRVVERDRVRVTEGRFIEYGPEDIPELLRRGIISEEEELLFYQMNTPWRWDSLMGYGVSV